MVPTLTSHYYMGPIWVQYGYQEEQLYHYLNIRVISKNSKFPDINANNNDNNNIKTIVCSLQNESIYQIDLNCFLRH